MWISKVGVSFDEIQETTKFPSELVNIVCEFIGLQNKKVYNIEVLIRELKEDEHLIVYEPDHKKRKELHELCTQFVTHLGFVNSEFQYEKRTLYWCRDCKTWKKEDSLQIKIEYCCTDDYDNPVCNDWRMICTNCRGIVFDYDGEHRERYKRKYRRSNNSILIIMSSQPDFVFKLIRKVTGMKRRTARTKEGCLFK